jgi:predicted transposase YdaD
MSIYEFDEEREMQLIREDEREIGRQEGERYGRQEGEKYGLRINELNKRLKAAGRTDDLLKSIDNPEYQKALMKEYGI